MMPRTFSFAVAGLTAALAAATCAPAHAAKSRPARRTVQPAQGMTAAEFIAAGRERLRARQYSTAIRSFQRATETDGASARAYAELGNAYYQRAFLRGRVEEADSEDCLQSVEAFQTAVAIDPDLSGVGEPYMLYHALAMCSQNLGKYADALAALKKAMLAAPDNPMPALYAARVRHKMREGGLSAENLHLGIRRAMRSNQYRALARLVRSDPGFSEMLTPLNSAILAAYDRVENGYLTETQAREKVMELTAMRDSLHDLAPATLRSASRRLAAPAAFDSAVQQLLSAADAEFKFRKFRNAISAYQKALKEDAAKGTLRGRARSRVHTNIGACYRQLGLQDEAIRSLELATRDAPDDPWAYYQLSLAYSVAGRFSASLGSLELAFRNARDPADARKLSLMSKTDTELDPLRDLPRFEALIAPRLERLSQAYP